MVMVILHPIEGVTPTVHRTQRNTFTCWFWILAHTTSFGMFYFKQYFLEGFTLHPTSKKETCLELDFWGNATKWMRVSQKQLKEAPRASFILVEPYGNGKFYLFQAHWGTTKLSIDVPLVFLSFKKSLQRFTYNSTGLVWLSLAGWQKC